MAYLNKKKSEDVTITFNVAEDNRKLMEFLLSNVKGKSRNNIKAMLSRGNITVNGKLQKQFDLDLYSGDVVCVQKTKVVDMGINPRLELLYEDESIIAVAKPSGLLSVSSERDRNNTVFNFVSDYAKKQNKDNKIFVVHRLDRDTSGVIIFAKNIETKNALQENWNELATYRGYTAVVEGNVKKPSGCITTFLTQTTTHFVYSTENESVGQKAITNYEVISSKDGYSLVDVNIQTGRKNQIRVHLSEMGNPVAGDKKYGGKTNPLGRLCLHAGRLKIKNPITLLEHDFKVEIPKNFIKLTK